MDKKKIQQLGITDDGDELILKREITKDGKSRCFINGEISNLNMLKELAEKLIDIHSQHQNQYLFNSDHHLYFYDQTLAIKESLISYKKLYFQLQETKKTIQTLETQGKKLIEEKDFLQYSLKEFDGNIIDEKEYLDLKERLSSLENLEKNNSFLLRFKELVQDQGLPLLERSIDELSKINISEQAEKIKKELLNSIQMVSDQSQEILRLSKYQDRISYSKEIDAINQKLSTTENLMRKYSLDHKSLFEKFTTIKDKLNLLENIEYEKKKYLKLQLQIEQEIYQIALKMHTDREKSIPNFESIANKEIHDLGIKQGSFKLQLTPILTANHQQSYLLDSLNDRGFDKLEFLFSPSKEIIPKPLKKIASGGELSRIMLAIKYVLNKVLPNGAIIFDEIDTGVGGISAVKIGEKIKEISEFKQVIVITHLPQIAKYANRHFKIEKNINQGKTESLVREINEKEILEEFTRMFGKEISDTNIDITTKFINE